MTNSAKADPTKRQTPEFMLVMVISFILWAIGLVDLLTQTNSNPDYNFIGSYTFATSIMLAAYSILFFIWLAILLIPRSHLWIQRIIRTIQNRLWFILPTFAAIGLIIWSLFRINKWGEFPGLGLALFCFMLLLTIILLVTGWGAAAGTQRWRKFIVIPLLLCLLIEGITQVAAYVGALPTMTINSGLYVPNGRVYQSEEGFANGRTNSNGWYYPEFEQTDYMYQVMLMGDSFLQALQIDPEENLGVYLQQQIQDNIIADTIKTEIFALGMPGFGPGLYLSETRLTHAVEKFQPNEIVLLFHLSNDFQVVTEPSGYELYYAVNADGVVDIHEDAWSHRHDLQHLILHGYESSLTPLKTLSTHMLAPKLIRQLLNRHNGESVPVIDPLDIPRITGEVISTRYADTTHTDVTNFRLVERPGSANFLFEEAENARAQESYQIAFGLLRQSNDFLKAKGVSLRIVTIPAFPAAFFDSANGDDWTADLGPYDLFLPERKLAEFAAAEEIGFLAMGQYMQQSDLTVEQIKELYFNNGRGHFTPAGHRYFAASIFDCLYSKNRSAACTID